MPLYVYACKSCEESFEVRHSITEELDVCQKCKSATISRIPSKPITFSDKKEKDRKTGDLTKEFIEDSRESLKREEYKQ